jgi:acetylxylan esterase
MRNMRKALAFLSILVAAMTGAWLAIAAPASAATLTEVTNFGTNPSNLRMYLYVPDRLAPSPGVLVAVHYCTGSGPAYYSGTEFASLADRHGFIVIYPSATRSGGCFDVWSQQALRRDGGSDPVGIASMVRYVLQRNNADPNRVYVAGSSSGAMMTNVLLGDYPDLFKAGAAFAGVPFSCFATNGQGEWNSQCANGEITRTAQQWGDAVRSAFPGYTGARPRMQLWHGTADDTLRYPNFTEEIKQWTNVHGLSQTPSFTDSPQANWTRTRYGGSGNQAPVEAISIQGGPHNILTNGLAARAITFFGLDSTTPSSGPPSPSPSPSSPPPDTSPPPVSSSPPPAGGACTATYRIVNQWSGGFQVEVTVRAGTAALNGWSVSWTFPGGQTIQQIWSGVNGSQGGAGNVAVRNASYNGSLPANGTTTFGFIASGAAVTPSSITCGP